MVLSYDVVHEQRRKVEKIHTPNGPNNKTVHLLQLYSRRNIYKSEKRDETFKKSSLNANIIYWIQISSLIKNILETLKHLSQS